MKKSLLSVFIFVSIATLHAKHMGRFQLWNSYLSQSSITKDFDFALFNEFRYQDNASTLSFYESRFQLLYTATSWLRIEPTYRQIYFRPIHKKHADWKTEFNPVLGFTLFKIYNGFDITDRNWVLYKIFSDPKIKNAWEYRNRLQVVTPWTFTKLKIAPMASNEVFFEERRGFYENRLLGGFLTPCNKNVDFLLAYMLRTIKFRREGFENFNVLMISLLFGF